MQEQKSQQQLKLLLTQFKTNPNDVKVGKQLGSTFFELQQYENAAKAFQHVLQFQPFNTDLYYKLGMTYLKMEDEKAIDAFQKVLDYHPKQDQKARLIAKTKLAKAYKLNEQYDKARKLIVQVLKKQSQNASALSILGQLEQQDEKTAEAHEIFLKVIELMPKNAAAHNNAGSTAFILKDYQESIQHFEEALKIKSNWSMPIREMARCYDRLGDAKKSLQLLKQAIKIAPKDIENYKYLTAFYRTQGNHKQAIEVGKHLLKIDPKNSEAYFNIGSSMTQLGITDACLPYFEKAFELDPTAQAAYAIGNVHKTAKEIEKANEWFKKTIELDETYYTGTYQLIANRAANCDWSQRPEDQQLILETLQKHLDSENTNLPIPTLYFNYFDISMQWHKAYNIHYAKTSEQQGKQFLKQFPIQHEIKAKKRLKIAYISPDFRNHPVGRLVANLFQHHDRKQFDLYGYSLAVAKEDDPYRPKIEAGFDHFRELCFLPTVQAAQQIRQDGIDILIDLGGHTAHTRPDLLAMQPAPIQAHMIGYPNTMGATYMQYILADKYLVPEHVFEHYTEKVVHLPSSFLGTAPQIPTIELTRSEVNLPEEGIVFVAFNRPSKIEPAIFQAWMNILRAVEGSVLWLSDFKEKARQNLQTAAKKAGIDPQRILFSEWQPYGKYLKSHQLCDLFLDTWHYSAGSTAIAALGAGLPVLTIVADNNASRMGASIVAATGQTDLICESLKEYEQKAIHLAQNPNQLQEYKQQLKSKPEQLLLFDNPTFARNMEKAFWEMWEDAVNEP